MASPAAAWRRTWLFHCILLGLACSRGLAVDHKAVRMENKQLRVQVEPAHGSYAVYTVDGSRPVLSSQVAVEVDHRWLQSRDYPSHHVELKDPYQDSLGSGRQITVSHSGLSGSPDLICILRVYNTLPIGTVEVRVVNTTSSKLMIQAIRTVDAAGDPPFDLGASPQEVRVLSDSFSEDRPDLKIYDLANAPDGMHRAVGSQLLYNTQNGQSLLLATLSSHRFLTLLHLTGHKDAGGSFQPAAYTVTSTGTTEILKGESLKDSPAQDAIELSLPLAPGETMDSESLMFAAGRGYHQQLETYGEIIRRLNHARTSSPSLIGWWSWTAYYFGLNEGAAITNAEWMASHLKSDGYIYFHFDEGYDYARGEYTNADAALFPHGMQAMGDRISRLGLRLGVWTAPFEVSERAWLYEKHKDWLVHNELGEPIHIGHVFDELDPLYVLDATNPEAQEYLRQTYGTLVHQWGVRYIKLDFMDDTAIEGHYYRPNTTALEAQQIGLKIIREAVGEDVVLDKDGSPMLNPVGFVDSGRISADTGHSFEASKEAEPGIAARYYMNRNFFVSDPDAYSVSRQPVIDPDWHGRVKPLSLGEARVSIVLAAVAGGMFELGDDLPALGAGEDRLALVRNPDLLAMARLGRAATPIDLMTYRPEDEQPSVFLLHQGPRQSMLAVFNWTDHPSTHHFSLQELGLASDKSYQVTDVLDPTQPATIRAGTLNLENQTPHSVRLLKIIDPSVPAAAPSLVMNCRSSAQVAIAGAFVAEAVGNVPALFYRWDFDDGISADGSSVSHAFTQAGSHRVRLHADGIDGLAYENTCQVTVRGEVDTHFSPQRNRRFAPENPAPHH